MKSTSEHTASADAPRPTSSLQRGLQILETVARAGPRGASVTEIATQLRLDKSTASRTLSALRDIGYLHQATSRRYLTTPKLAKLAARPPGELDLAALARGRLEELQRELDEAIFLAIPDGAEMLFLDHLPTSKAVRAEVSTTPRPMHDVAVGIAVLATEQDEDRLEEMIAASQEAMGAQLTDAERIHLDHQILRARERGWATIDRDDDISRVAVTIVGPDGRTRGSLCVTGPSYRLDAIRERVVRAATAAAKDISAALSH